MGDKKIDVKWYEENYTPWIEGINSYEDLEKFWDNLNPRYKRRFDHWFKGIELKGVSVLELGFNNGKTLKWLNDRYEDIHLYGIDFNPSLEKIIPHLRLIRSVITLRITDGKELRLQYHNIMCLDFIEHLYHKDYLNMIRRCHYLLFDKGRIYVFAGYAKQVEHVNILTLEEIRNDFEAAGFKFIKKIGHPETGDYLQIFEK